MSGSYRDLKVWQKSIELSIDIYRLTERFPREELFSLTAQMRRAAVSVASNIAEGYGRASRNEFRRFIGIARGSILEVQTQLVIARRLNFGKVSQRQPAERGAEELGKMLWRLHEKLSATEA